MWKIKLKHPVNWDLKMKFFVLPDKPTPDLVLNGKWMRALKVGERLIPVIVYPEDSSTIVVETTDLSDTERKYVENSVEDYLGLGNPKKLYEFMNGDEKLKELVGLFRGFGRAGMMSMSVYEGVIKAVIQQQISFVVAEKIVAKIVERLGNWVEFKGLRVYSFPEPDEFISAGIEKLRNCGLSRRKAEVIMDISNTALDFDFEELRDMDELEVYEFLTSFKGIGRWTAELVMSMAIGMNVIPADDLGVRRAISNLYFKGELQDSETIRKLAEEKFGEYKRDILFYLFLHDRLK